MRKLIEERGEISEGKSGVVKKILAKTSKALEKETEAWAKNDLIKSLKKKFKEAEITDPMISFNRDELIGSVGFWVKGENRPQLSKVYQYLMDKFDLEDDDIHAMKRRDGDVFTVFVDLNG